MHILDEVKRHLKDECPFCGTKSPAYQVFLKHDNEATLVYRCHKNHIWTQKVILDVEVSEIGH